MCGGVLPVAVVVCDGVPGRAAAWAVVVAAMTAIKLATAATMSVRIHGLHTTSGRPGTNLVAGMFNFREERFFELDDASERAAPQVRMN